MHLSHLVAVGLVVATCTSAHRSSSVFADSPVIHVFTQAEIDQCLRFRVPNIVHNERTHQVHVIARCCGKNRCGQTGDSAGDTGVNQLGDDLTTCRVVMKSSNDGGLSWGNFTILSPMSGGTTLGFGNGAGLYDRVNNRIVVQYQYLPHGVTTPAKDVTNFQIVSADDGMTWSPPRNINPYLTGCNKNTDNYYMQSAGNKVQTASGRMIWTGHNVGGVCIWYSDDYGQTYNSTARLPGNEVSVCAGQGKNELLMNGRGMQFSWAPHRADYWSSDNGATWTQPEKSPLMDDAQGCERALINVNGTLYTSEPQGPVRTMMVVQCSMDSGQTWPKSININGNARGGYSDLTYHADKLLMVWEDEPTGNFFSSVFASDWC